MFGYLLTMAWISHTLVRRLYPLHACLYQIGVGILRRAEPAELERGSTQRLTLTASSDQVTNLARAVYSQHGCDDPNFSIS
jgi:hypothetical protein